MNIENQVKAIDKFVTKMYKPDLVHIEEMDKSQGYKVIFYFDEIGDKYILNPRAHNMRAHKTEVLRKEIVRFVNDFLGIKTLGFQPPDYFAPSEFHPINIIVTYTDNDRKDP